MHSAVTHKGNVAACQVHAIGRLKISGRLQSGLKILLRGLAKPWLGSVVRGSMAMVAPLMADVSPNQTQTLSPILPGNALPFQVTIELADFALPDGLQTYAWALCGNQWLLVSGRTNGLHGFDNTNDNFPPRQQNTRVYVVDPSTGITKSKSLFDPTAGLTQRQIDTISATAVEYHQTGHTLYLVGGYGVDTATGQFTTKDTLTAIDVPGLMEWVLDDRDALSACQFIRQTSHPFLRVTGGALVQAGPHHPYLLVFGQDFEGFYSDSSNGIYTEQVRPFWIVDNGRDLFVQPIPVRGRAADYRRRDLNVAPIINQRNRSLEVGYVALSGVFTLNSGIWTVPVFIDADGHPCEPDPTSPGTFKQGMNNYASSIISLFSKRLGKNYIVLPGGLTYLYEQNGQFLSDTEVPFTNEVTTLAIDGCGHIQQYLMEATYPVILSEFVHPGNTLLFGAGSHFIPVSGVLAYSAPIVDFDALPAGSTLLGYIVGGIQSTLPDTVTNADSAASPYVFKVTLTKSKKC
ncbi:MAG: hypothetical protein ACOYKZ_02935 [Chlamydiia bacterium]